MDEFFQGFVYFCCWKMVSYPLFGLYVGRFWSMLKVFEEFSFKGHHCWPSYQQQSPKIPPCGKSINTFAHAESLARQRHDLQGPREACDGNILWKYNREHIQQAYLCEILLMSCSKNERFFPKQWFALAFVQLQKLDANKTKGYAPIREQFLVNLFHHYFQVLPTKIVVVT